MDVRWRNVEQNGEPRNGSGFNCATVDVIILTVRCSLGRAIAIAAGWATVLRQAAIARDTSDSDAPN